MNKKSEKNYALVTGVSYRIGGVCVKGGCGYLPLEDFVYPVVQAYNHALKYFYIEADLDNAKQVQEIESCIPGDRIQYKTIDGQKEKTYQIVKNLSAQDRLAQYLNEVVIEKQK